MKTLAPLLRETWYGITINGIVASPLIPRQLRWRALRALGVNIERCVIAGRVFFGRPTRIAIGHETFINYGAFLDGSGGITIGKAVSFGPDVMIITATHAVGSPSKRAGTQKVAPVSVGDGAWLGARVTLLPGITVGDGCVIAAQSVVTADCDANALYAGVPARRIRSLN